MLRLLTSLLFTQLISLEVFALENVETMSYLASGHGTESGASAGSNTQNSTLIGSYKLNFQLHRILGNPMIIPNFSWNWHKHAIYTRVLGGGTYFRDLNNDKHRDLYNKLVKIRPVYVKITADIDFYGDRLLNNDKKLGSAKVVIHIDKFNNAGKGLAKGHLHFEPLSSIFSYPSVNLNSKDLRHISIKLLRKKEGISEDHTKNEILTTFAKSIKLKNMKIVSARWNDKDFVDIFTEYDKRKHIEGVKRITNGVINLTREDVKNFSESYVQAVSPVYWENEEVHPNVAPERMTHNNYQYTTQALSKLKKLKKKWNARLNDLNHSIAPQTTASSNISLMDYADIAPRPGKEHIADYSGKFKSINLKRKRVAVVNNVLDFKLDYPGSKGIFILNYGMNDISFVAGGVNDIVLKEHFLVERTGQRHDIRFTLLWDNDGSDMDLHVRKGSSSSDLVCNHRSRQVEDMTLDTDNTKGAGPENITIEHAERNTSYTPSVVNYSKSSDTKFKVYVFKHELLQPADSDNYYFEGHFTREKRDERSFQSYSVR